MPESDAIPTPGNPTVVDPHSYEGQPESIRMRYTRTEWLWATSGGGRSSQRTLNDAEFEPEHTE